jgi:hypothetical protein
MAWYDFIVDALGGEDKWQENAARLGLGGLGASLALQSYEDIGGIGERAYGEFTGEGGLAEQLSGMLEFQPYTVTSATGGQFGMGIDPNTGQMQYNLQLSPEEQQLYQDQLQRAGMFFEQAAMPTAKREDLIYGRIRDSMAAEEERQRLDLEQRLAAQGRLGVTTGMFGGTPEALTLAKAQAEALTKARLGAMEFAGQEQQRLAGLGTGMLAAGYMPQAQLLSGIQPGMTAAEQRRQAIAQQAGTYGQTYAAGLEALLTAAQAKANLAGGFGSNIAQEALGGLFGG